MGNEGRNEEGDMQEGRNAPNRPVVVTDCEMKS